MKQPTLFDADRTQTTSCPVCGELRESDEAIVRHCPSDHWADGYPGKRPVGCLNAYDPEHAEIPY